MFQVLVFFHDSYFCKVIKKWIERIFSNEKKIIVGTSDAWSPSCLAHWLSVPVYNIENWLISITDKHTLHYFNRFLMCHHAVICPRVMWSQHHLKLQLLRLLQLQHHPSLPRHLPLLLRLRPLTPIHLRICLPGNLMRLEKTWMVPPILTTFQMMIWWILKTVWTLYVLKWNPTNVNIIHWVKFGLKLARLAVLFSRQLLNGSQDFFKLRIH